MNKNVTLVLNYVSPQFIIWLTQTFGGRFIDKQPSNNVYTITLKDVSFTEFTNLLSRYELDVKSYSHKYIHIVDNFPYKGEVYLTASM